MTAKDIETQIIALSNSIEANYERLREISKVDPGTAGDQGEENWAEILRFFLPETFKVITKGRILYSNGDTSPQLDVIILKPEYPSGFLASKLFISAGVVAAFECKNSLKLSHLEKVFQTSKTLSNEYKKEKLSLHLTALRQPFDKPIYEYLHKPIIFGVLAHTHGVRSKNPRTSFDKSLENLHMSIPSHPSEIPDIFCVSGLGTWSTSRLTSGFGIENGVACEIPKSNSILTDFRSPESPILNHSPLVCLAISLFVKLGDMGAIPTDFAVFFRNALQISKIIGGETRSRDWEEVFPREALERLANEGRVLSADVGLFLFA